jgi:hypothetical protein
MLGNGFGSDLIDHSISYQQDAEHAGKITGMVSSVS